MSEEQQTEVFVTATAEQIQSSQPTEQFAIEKQIIAKLAELYPKLSLLSQSSVSLLLWDFSS